MQLVLLVGLGVMIWSEGVILGPLAAPDLGTRPVDMGEEHPGHKEVITAVAMGCTRWRRLLGSRPRRHHHQHQQQRHLDSA